MLEDWLDEQLKNVKAEKFHRNQAVGPFPTVCTQSGFSEDLQKIQSSAVGAAGDAEDLGEFAR